MPTVINGLYMNLEQPEILVEILSYIDDKKDNARLELVNKVRHKRDACSF